MSRIRSLPAPSQALRRTIVLALALLFGVLLVPPAAVADGPLDQQARDIAKDLQCPICENQSVADSPSELATQMRGIILEQLQAGRTRQEIMAYFVARYGEVVLRDPPKEGFNLLVWWVPPIALAFAAALIAWTLSSRLVQAGTVDEEAPDLTDQERERYERQIEQELHGGVEGRPS